MKPCNQCGKENEDSAIRCVSCGSEGFPSDSVETANPQRQRVASADPPLPDTPVDPTRLFRTLVVVANGAYVLGLLAPYLERLFLSYETLELLSRSGHSGLMNLPNGVCWLITVLYLVIAVGLYHWSASARAAFTIFTVGFAMLGLLSGVSVLSPVVGFLAFVTATADGAILVLAYATPLKDRFV